MGLVVGAQVIRQLIADGEYLLECIEQRERGKVAVTLALRSRLQPYSLQIETTDDKLAGLFRALLEGQSPQHNKAMPVKLGSQEVPTVKVDSLPGDTPKAPRRRKRSGEADASTPAGREGAPRRRRSAGGQLSLVPQDASADTATPTPPPSKPRRAARANDLRGQS